MTMRDTVSFLLRKAERVWILVTDPHCGVLRARFRLHKGRQHHNMRHEAERQHEILKDLAQDHPAGALEYKLCDLMPFGFFVQGQSIADGRWMIVGLMPAINAYTVGPMIMVRPTVSHLWDLFEETWKASWSSPTDPESEGKGAGLRGLS